MCFSVLYNLQWYTGLDAFDQVCMYVKHVLLYMCVSNNFLVFLTLSPLSTVFVCCSGRMSHTNKISPSGIDSSPKSSSSSSVNSSNSSISSTGSTTGGTSRTNPNNAHFVESKSPGGVMSSAAIPIPMQGHQAMMAQAEVYV